MPVMIARNRRYFDRRQKRGLSYEKWPWRRRHRRVGANRGARPMAGRRDIATIYRAVLRKIGRSAESNRREDEEIIALFAASSSIKRERGACLAEPEMNQAYLGERIEIIACRAP